MYKSSAGLCYNVFMPNKKPNAGTVIFAAESSCDETAAAVLRCSGESIEVLSDVVCSQIEMHRQFGGVVPELASRSHAEVIDKVADEAVRRAGIDISDIDMVAATYGPGLNGALLAALSFAKGLAFSLSVPFIGVNHIRAHIAANYIGTALKPPFLALTASGGHSSIMLMSGYDSCTVIGGTLDDAAGEAFDKVARVMGLGYPGGPAIEKAAANGEENINFYRHPLKNHGYDFSYSGLKTAVINYINTARQKSGLTQKQTADIAASFQKAALDMLLRNVSAALKEYRLDTLALAGGVAANTALRERLKTLCEKENIKLFVPPLRLCGDNAVMIGAAAWLKYLEKGAAAFSPLSLNSSPSLKACD